MAHSRKGKGTAQPELRCSIFSTLIVSENLILLLSNLYKKENLQIERTVTACAVQFRGDTSDVYSGSHVVNHKLLVSNVLSNCDSSSGMC